MMEVLSDDFDEAACACHDDVLLDGAWSLNP